MSDQEGVINQPVDISKRDKQYHQRIPVEEAAEDINQSLVGDLPELLTVHRCTSVRRRQGRRTQSVVVRSAATYSAASARKHIVGQG